MSTIVRDLPQNDEPFQMAPPAYEYPFINHGDSWSFILTRFYKQTIAGYNRDRLAAKYLPGDHRDSGHPEAVMVGESKPTRTATAMVVFSRTFARVPQEQLSYGSRVITKPNASALGVAEGAARSYVNSDTFEEIVTYKNSTTAAIAYNESDANVAAAINGLADVSGDGITVTAGNALSGAGTLTLTLTAGATSSRFTGDGSSLNPAASRTMFTNIQTSTVQTISIAYRGTLTAHGFDAAKNVLVFSASGGTLHKLLPPTTWWVAVDANTLAFGTVANGATHVGQKSRDYTPGTDRVGTRAAQRFYLPGFTDGIATPADIPVPAVLLNDAEFLRSVTTNLTGYQTYDASELTRWLDGPIYTQTFVEIDMADV
jgi:hypothetical protein